MNEIKACMDCKWRGRDWFVPARLQYCNNSKVSEAELRRSPGESGRRFASIERDSYHSICGREGKLFQRR